MSSMRSILIFLLVFSLTAASQAFAQEPDKTLKSQQGAAELTDEDKEIIKNLEEIENIDWLVDTDLDLLENLDLFLTNS